MTIKEGSLASTIYNQAMSKDNKYDLSRHLTNLVATEMRPVALKDGSYAMKVRSERDLTRAYFDTGNVPNFGDISVGGVKSDDNQVVSPYDIVRMPVAREIWEHGSGDPEIFDAIVEDWENTVDTDGNHMSLNIAQAIEYDDIDAVKEEMADIKRSEGLQSNFMGYSGVPYRANVTGSKIEYANMVDSDVDYYFNGFSQQRASDAIMQATIDKQKETEPELSQDTQIDVERDL